jgi:hypothetical protein
MAEFSGVMASAMIGIIGRKESMAQKSKVVAWQGHQNLLIESNRFLDWRNVPALRLGCASGVKVHDNVFETLASETGETPPPAICVFNASDVDIRGNRVVGWPDSSQQAIVIDEKSTQGVKLKADVETDGARQG